MGVSEDNHGFHSHLVRLRPRPDVLYTGQSRTVMATAMDGQITGTLDTGLFAYETRVLSRYCYLIEGKPPIPVALSNYEQHNWMGYYIEVPHGAPKMVSAGSGHMEQASEQTLELRVSRQVGPGVHEDLDFTNFSRVDIKFHFAVEVDADFADVGETEGNRQQYGKIRRSWIANVGGAATLAFDYRASHHYRHQGNRGTAHVQRGLIIRVENAGSQPSYKKGRLIFTIKLRPHASWHACIHLVPVIEGQRLESQYRCRSFCAIHGSFDRSRASFLSESTQFTTPAAETLEPVVVGALNQAKRDLAALRLHDLDHGQRAWTMAAGLPLYVALFGRDTLGASWQASILGPEMMSGTLIELAEWQGRERNDWRDEEPGRMLHEAHTGPVSSLCYDPRSRYYGSATTSSFYPFALSELWHWTGDKDLVRPLIEPSLRAMASKEGRRRRGGFYEYKTRSEQGVKNQSWKDSGDAIVYEDGTQVNAPIGTCEEQAFVYIGKAHMAELLWWFDEKDAAKRFHREAVELKKRFNDVFWMEDQGFFAMGLDGKNRLIKSIGSNPGHCVGAGIVDEALIERTARRLMADDLFSGWGVRTLSSQHPAFDPFSYHRGSVWPVEQGAFAIGFWRYGLHAHVEKIARALFEAAALFDYYRLPEVFSGHQRDADHPFPAIYPKANSPQAWSASATFCLIQAMLGIYPYAPLNLLFVDPHLPEWLPTMTVGALRVGKATVSLRFSRERDGSSSYEVLDKQGTLHLVRQPSPWSLTAGYGERVKDLLASFLPGK
jgi:glycogen debranching enzyme